MSKLDVAIVGAGVAGLAAARELSRRRRRLVVLEARARIGGRVHTLHEPGIALPIELGAEFVHGAAEETERLLSEAGLLAVEVSGRHWQARGGRLAPIDLRAVLDPLLSKIDPDQPDVPFSDWLAKGPGGARLARARTWARTFAEGFFGAELELIGAHALGPSDGQLPTESALRAARIVQGQGALVEWLARDLGSSVLLDRVVSRIEWQRGRAELAVRARTGRLERVTARAVLVTVPLGVLQAPAGSAGAIALDPEPPRFRRAIERLAMGSVLRVVFALREYPWLAAAGARQKLDDLGFLHTPGEPFNVWWSAHPARQTLAVAWAGGPPALELSRGSKREIHAAALDALARALDRPRREVASRVRTAWSHDWMSDPFSRGAYSYPKVGGSEAPTALSRPYEGTLFFAGEATNAEAIGTVEGALASGIGAARKIERALRSG